MKQIRTAAALLLSAVLFASCAADDAASDTAANIQKTAAEAVEVQTEERTERWIEIGSRAYADGTESDFDAAAYFDGKSPANTVLALSDDMYFHDPEAFEAVSAMVYRYIRDTHGEDALTDTAGRAAYKDEWIKTVDPSLSYSQDIVTEDMLSRITASSSDDYEIIAELNGATYCYYSYDSSITPYLAHSIMYYADEGLSLLRAELERIDPDGAVFNTSANPGFVMDFSGYTVMLPGGSYSIGRYEDILAAAVMMMAENADPEARWMTEGLAEVLGKARGYYFYAVYDRVFYLHPSTEETLRAYADAGEAVGLFHTSVMDNYYSHGGEIIEGNVPEEFSHIVGYRYSIDGELYTHAAALANMGCEYMPSLKTLYTSISDGGDLSRIEAGSFVLWLMENHGIGEIIEVCRDYSALSDVFGMSYDELEAEWTAWLEAKFE